MSRRVLGWFVVGFVCIARETTAQSLTLEAKEEPSPSRSAPSEPPSRPVASPEPLMMPKLITGDVKYPDDAEGEHEVMLDLTIASDGSVKQATATEGDPLFVKHAEAAALQFRFEPARRGALPVAAKIRFLVRFVPPAIPGESEEEDAPAQTPILKPPSQAEGEPNVQKVYEIVVLGERAPIRHRLGRAEVREMPGAFGDPYRAIEALPGVVPIFSGLPYFYVRGAPPGNVGYFFDGIPVPLLYHFAAGPGVLHPEFVEHVDLYPGAYPARYGRFAGAIVAGEMAPPTNRPRGAAEIRLIDSGAMVEAPLNEGRTSVMLGGRYSYTGAVLSLAVPEVTLNYWDYQSRIRHALSNTDTVEALFFGAGDYLSNTEQEYDSNADGSWTVSEKEQTIVDIHFHRLDLRWDHGIERGNWRNALMLGLDRTFIEDGELSLQNYMLGGRSEFRQLSTDGVEMSGGADVLFESLSQTFLEDDFDLGEGTPGTNGQTLEPTDSPSDDPTAADLGFTPARNDFTVGVYGELAIDVARGLRLTPGLRVDVFMSGGDAALS